MSKAASVYCKYALKCMQTTNHGHRKGGRKDLGIPRIMKFDVFLLH